MTGKALFTGAAASSEKIDRVRLRDVLRLDVPKLHAAFTSASGDANAPVRLLFKLVDEHRSKRKTRILYCPPLPLLWGFASGDGSAQRSPLGATRFGELFALQLTRGPVPVPPEA
jgi:hypothetical protein